MSSQIYPIGQQTSLFCELAEWVHTGKSALHSKLQNEAAVKEIHGAVAYE